MTAVEKFNIERMQITAALEAAGMTVHYNKDDVPKNLPAAIVTLESETGKNGTARRYVDTDLAWTVYLIVNAVGVVDPDGALYSLKESFRGEYQTRMGRDVPYCEYYTSRVDGSRLVRIARLDLVRQGVAAAT